jgi:hypothetical protein
MSEQELAFANPQIAIAVSSSRRISPDAWEITLKDGSVLTVNSKGNRLETDTSAPWYLPFLPRDVRIAADGDGMRTAQVPEGLKFSAEQDIKSEYDVSSLSGAQYRLRGDGDFVARLVHGMAEVKNLVNGTKRAETSALGAFSAAQVLKARHDGLFMSFEAGLRGIADELYGAQDGLGTVAKNYQAAEDYNRMTAEQLEQILAARNQVKPESGGPR